MNEFNICGVLVMVRPDAREAVEQRLTRLPGVEVHAGDADGRLVVTVEDTSEANCTETISALTDIDGVLATSLVYHEIATEESLQEAAQ